MKIAVFFPQFRGGGAEKIMIEFANYLCTLEGYSVQIIVANDNGPYKTLVDPRIHVKVLGKQKVFFAFFPLYSYLRKENFDCIYSTLMKANLISILSCLFLRTKAIIREANTLKEAKINAKKLSVKFSLFLAKYLYKYAYKCIAISNHVKQDLLSFTNCDENNIQVIYNPIFIVDIIEDAKVEQGSLQVCFVSRLTLQKNIDTICEFIEFFVSNNMRVHFHFFGEGEERYKIQLLKEKYRTARITLHGFNISYYSYLKHMNLFIHIPHWEGLGNSVLEAYNSGIPMILSDINSGYSELIRKDMPNVHYVKPSDNVREIISIILAYMTGDAYVKNKRTELAMSRENVFTNYLKLY